MPRRKRRREGRRTNTTRRMVMKMKRKVMRKMTRRKVTRTRERLREMPWRWMRARMVRAQRLLEPMLSAAGVEVVGQDEGGVVGVGVGVDLALLVVGVEGGVEEAVQRAELAAAGRGASTNVVVELNVEDGRVVGVGVGVGKLRRKSMTQSKS
jgi:hypothetical protein